MNKKMRGNDGDGGDGDGGFIVVVTPVAMKLGSDDDDGGNGDDNSNRFSILVVRDRLCRNCSNSQTIEHTQRYLASHEDLLTVDCFLVFQETTVSPR
ncbi:uncharacterized protein G2W53_016384 [Senna tora]|uniref:Uncharacterized protein n=1 Tax=Senna tora TaxID=362788 RepID=A0A834TRE3_9FABA|nr:uncharacterized protein G2W53_016384 [Senna tora]